MAITILKNFTSNKFYPSSNPINITVSSNNTGKCNFRFICDLYINGIKVNSQKLFPDPTTGFAFFQVSRVIQDYIDNLVVKVTSSEIINLAATAAAPSAALSVYCRFGEEYDSTTTCDGSILQYPNLATSNTFYAYQAAIDYEYFPSYDSSKYVFATASAPNKLFLTNGSREVDVTYNDSYFLDFLSLQTINASYSVVAKLFDSSNSLLTTKTWTKTLANTKRYRIAVGPFDINYYEDDVVISPSVSYYTITVNFSGTPISETFTFNVKCPKTFRTRIAFVGLLGGIEHFTFYHRRRKSYNIERKNFQKGLQRNYSNDWTYQVGDRGMQTYGVNANEVNVVSSFCTERESEYLYEMWLSPDVWTYLEPTLSSFRTINDGALTKFWVDGEHGLVAGDVIYTFTSNATYSDKWTIVSVVGNIINVGLTAVSGSDGLSGYLHKRETWKKLPIMISDNVVEVKEKLGRPIEYSLNWQSAWTKTTLR